MPLLFKLDLSSYVVGFSLHTSWHCCKATNETPFVLTCVCVCSSSAPFFTPNWQQTGYTDCLPTQQEHLPSFAQSCVSGSSWEMGVEGGSSVCRSSSLFLILHPKNKFGYKFRMRANIWLFLLWSFSNTVSRCICIFPLIMICRMTLLSLLCLFSSIFTFYLNKKSTTWFILYLKAV